MRAGRLLGHLKKIHSAQHRRVAILAPNQTNNSVEVTKERDSNIQAKKPFENICRLLCSNITAIYALRNAHVTIALQQLHLKKYTATITVHITLRNLLQIYSTSLAYKLNNTCADAIFVQVSIFMFASSALKPFSNSISTARDLTCKPFCQS